MKFSRIYAAQPHNLKGHVVTVEIDISRGMHSFSVIGLPDKSVEESRDRVNSAIKNSEYPSPKTKNEKLVVSLAPAELKKEGSYFDLAIALGYLLSSEEISFDVEGKLFLGALSLNGDIMPVQGILPITQAARDAGMSEIYVPVDNAREAALVSGIDVYPVRNLRQIVQHLDMKLDNRTPIIPQETTNIEYQSPNHHIDFQDVQGQAVAKRGLEIAAVGGHNVAMFGPPGTGKTMLARAFSSLLPELELKEALEVTGIHSVAGALKDTPILNHPPLRSPHHTSSHVAIVGGGAHPKPGEITLAHRGVLFLDEFPEFDKRVIESLRQPLEDRVVTISRARGTVSFPASFILLAAMNPCPCGFYGSEHKRCSCSPYEIQRYAKKLSGPIVDRIDIWLPVEHIEYEKLTDSKPDGKPSSVIRKRVIQARAFGRERIAKAGLTHQSNSEMTSRDVQNETLSSDVREILNKSAQKLALSPRAFHRVIKLARTIADMESSHEIQTPHILEALQYRPQFQ